MSDLSSEETIDVAQRIASARGPVDETLQQAADAIVTDDVETSDSPQQGLFDRDEWQGWRSEWQGMPEFRQPDLTPAKTLIVHFETAEKLKEFAELIGQKIAMTTRSIWYPQLTIGSVYNKAYVNLETLEKQALADAAAEEKYEPEP